jgi:hypothetical protein
MEDTLMTMRIDYPMPEKGTIVPGSVIVRDHKGNILEGYVVDHQRGTITFGTWQEALRARKPA